tara:strand:- start:2746 stop:3126 length:381 start_codon:yes stop_codon:yes gene_type:complete
MTAQLKDATVDDTAKIAAQNDAFRGSIMFFNDTEDTPKGQFVMTRGVMALGPDARLAATRAVAAFQAFTPDNDPNGFHEFGAVEVLGTRVWFKIDAYDVNYEYGSPDPSNPEQTRRVLTLLLPSEY